MPKNNEEINLARIVYDTYPHSDLLPIDPEQDCSSLQSLLAKVTTENIGDSLFQFLIVEIVEPYSNERKQIMPNQGNSARSPPALRNCVPRKCYLKKEKNL